MALAPMMLDHPDDCAALMVAMDAAERCVWQSDPTALQAFIDGDAPLAAWALAVLLAHSIGFGAKGALEAALWTVDGDSDEDEAAS